MGYLYFFYIFTYLQKDDESIREQEGRTSYVGKRLSKYWESEVKSIVMQSVEDCEERLRILVMFPAHRRTELGVQTNP